jgi:hypothetical protein
MSLMVEKSEKKLLSIGAAGDKAFPSAKAMAATRWRPLGSGAASLRISAPRVVQDEINLPNINAAFRTFIVNNFFLERMAKALPRFLLDQEREKRQVPAQFFE